MTNKANTIRWRELVSRPVDGEDFHPISSVLEVDVAAASLYGTGRSHNTDHYLAMRFGRLQETLVTSLAASDLPPPFEEYAYAMLIADGLDNSVAGVRASRVALSTLAKLAIRYGRWNVRADSGTLAEIVEQGDFFYRQVNESVLQESRSDFLLNGMATSLTALYIAETELTFAHVGHSRAFLFRRGVLTQLTRDHTCSGNPATDATEARDLKADQVHSVTHSLGSSPGGPHVEIEHVGLTNGDRLVLCTNGLTDVVNQDQIADTLALHRHPVDDCQRLIDLASAAGRPDDVTVMLADYRLSRDTAGSPTTAGRRTTNGR